MKKSYSFLIITFLVMCFIFTNKVKAEYVEFQPDSTYYYTTDNVAHNTSLFSFNGYGYGFKGGRPNVQNNVFAYGWNHYTNVSSLIDISKHYDVSFYVYTSYDNKPMVTFGPYNTCSVESSQTLDTFADGQSLPNSLQQEHVGNIYGVKCTNVTLTDNIDIILVTSEKGLGCHGCTYGTSFDFAYGITTTLKFDLTDSVRENSDNIIESIEKGNQNTNDIKNNTKETNDLIKSDNVSGAESSADDLKNNTAFQDSTGLSGIISMPLTFVNNLGSTCQPISLTIPYMDYTFSLPCLQSIINNYMPALVVVLKVIVNGLIIYWVMLDIFKIVKSAKNPDDDRIEVLDL